MSDPSDTQKGETSRRISEQVQLPRTGIVTKVYEHTDEDDFWNFHVDIKIGPESHPRKVPVATAAPELITPPRSTNHPSGPDLALVQYMEDDDAHRPIVTNILYNDQDRPPLGKEGVVRLRRGSLYVEMADDGSYARLAKKNNDDDGRGESVMEVTIDEVDNEIKILTNGQNIKLGDRDGSFKDVARRGDSVEVSDPESGTLNGSITGGSDNVEST
jgi:hypothetical protein